jgi:hypothetical protein
MATRKIQNVSPPPKPTEAPREGAVWAYNYMSKKWEEVRAGAQILSQWPYNQNANPNSQTATAGVGSMVPMTGVGSPPGGREATPAEAAAAAEYARSRIDAEEERDKKSKTKDVPVVPPAQKIDWEGIVNAIQKDALTAAKELYGSFYGIIEGNEEIKKLVLEAYLNKWTREKFFATLPNTDWYKNTDEFVRKFDIAEAQDPPTMRIKIARQAAQIKETALQKGVRLPEASAQTLARDSLRYGWDELTLANAIGAEVFKAVPSTDLSRSYITQSARTTANQYGIALSESSILDWTEKILTGGESDQTYKDYLLNQAKILYPSLADSFDRGLAFSTITSPYAERASQILEIPASEIDFTDPKFAAAFTSKDPSGKQTMMTYGEWSDYLKSDPAFGYEYTDGAKNDALDLVGRIARLFGAG